MTGYEPGGAFEAHEDGYCVTVNVLLDAGSFRGGGTAFYKNEVAEDGGVKASEAPAVLLEPKEAGLGVVFNGNVRHAGVAVTAGRRYLYVASFDLE